MKAVQHAQWISVNESLPSHDETSKDFLVNVEFCNCFTNDDKIAPTFHRVYIAQRVAGEFRANIWWIKNEPKFEKKWRITHWMRLPESVQ